MATYEVTDADLATAMRFQEETGLSVDTGRMRISKAGNLCMPGDDWEGELVIRPSDGALVALPPGRSHASMPQLQGWPWASETRAPSRPRTPIPSRRKAPTPRPPTPSELYWRENDGGFPDEVIGLLRKDLTKGQIFTTWQKRLISSTRLELSEDGKSLTVEYGTKGKSRALVSLMPVTVRRVTGWQRNGIASAEDEAKAMEKELIRIPYRMTESGDRRVREACRKEARARSRAILDASGLTRAAHRLPNDGFDDCGRDILDGLLDGEPSVDVGDVASHYSRRSPKTRDHWNPTFILCRMGKARLYYDIRDGSVTMPEADEEAVTLYAATKRNAKAYVKACEAFREAFDPSTLSVGPSDTRGFDLTVSTVIEHDLRFDYGSPAGRQVLDMAERVRSEDAEVVGRLRERCERTGLVGDLIAMEVMGFLVANHGSDSADYVTANVLHKEFKGHPITIWSGVERTWLSGRLAGLTLGDLDERIDRLREAGLITSRRMEYKRNGYWDWYTNLRAVMPAASVFMSVSDEPAPNGTPVDGMTEAQLLSLLDGDVASRPQERLAEELPVLLEHPACYYARPGDFQAYVDALSEVLRDYVRLTYKMSADRTQRKMLRAVLAGMGD